MGKGDIPQDRQIILAKPAAFQNLVIAKSRTNKARNTGKRAGDKNCPFTVIISGSCAACPGTAGSVQHSVGK